MNPPRCLVRGGFAQPRFFTQADRPIPADTSHSGALPVGSGSGFQCGYPLVNYGKLWKTMEKLVVN